MTMSVQAQSQDNLNLTLQKAIDIALEKNYQLKVAENNVELSKKEVLSNKADYLPSVDANLSGNRNIGRTFNQNTGQITDRSNNSMRTSISASLPIFSGLENLHSLKSSRFDQKSSEENRDRVREDIIFNTAI